MLLKNKWSQRIVVVFISIIIPFGFYSFTKKEPTSLGIRTVVIDAGHGGHDVGCVGASSHEKDVALAIALKLGKAIEKEYEHVNVIFTRDKDEFVTLENRAKIANDNNADLFICIHANANNNKSAYGSETYVMGLHKSNANLNVAKRENASILMEENYETTYGGFDPNSDESYIAFSLMQSTFLAQSLLFAAKVQKQFAKAGRKDRGVKQAGFLVLYRTTMPSVLIETGFLSNKEEEAFLTNPKNQQQLASSIFTAFKEYKNEIEGVEIKTSKITPKTKEVKPTTQKLNSGESVKSTNKIEPKEPIAKVNKDSKKSAIIYRVQIISSSQKIPLNSPNFKDFKAVFEYQQYGSYKYALGGSENIQQASEIQLKAREKGFKDAFVVAFYNGKRISISKAMELSK